MAGSRLFGLFSPGRVPDFGHDDLSLLGQLRGFNDSCGLGSCTGELAWRHHYSGIGSILHSGEEHRLVIGFERIEVRGQGDDFLLLGACSVRFFARGVRRDGFGGFPVDKGRTGGCNERRLRRELDVDLDHHFDDDNDDPGHEHTPETPGRRDGRLHSKRSDECCRLGGAGSPDSSRRQRGHLRFPARILEPARAPSPISQSSGSDGSSGSSGDAGSSAQAATPATSTGSAPSLSFGEALGGTDENIGCNLVGLGQVGALAPGETQVQAAAVNAALGLLGTPYVWGGESKQGFDCSGLVQFVFDTAGVHLPRVAQDQYDAGPAVPPGSPVVPGDLVFFGSSPQSVVHVGMFVGDGLMINAPYTGAVVRFDRVAGSLPIVGVTSPGGQQIA